MKKNKTALITGASKGLGFALSQSLAHLGWNLIINARDARQLLIAKKKLEAATNVVAISGDVRDEIHLLQLVDALKNNEWNLDLVINNASILGTSPLTPLLEQPIEVLHQVFHTNSIAPISLLQKIKPFLQSAAIIINVSSDAAKEAYESWGTYSGSKAALDHMTAILGKENPEFRFYAIDPGDMRTDMHQAAFPGEDISDRPLPTEHAVPAIVHLINNPLPNGRYTVSSLLKLEHANF